MATKLGRLAKPLGPLAPAIDFGGNLAKDRGFAESAARTPISGGFSAGGAAFAGTAGGAVTFGLAAAGCGAGGAVLAGFAGDAIGDVIFGD